MHILWLRLFGSNPRIVEQFCLCVFLETPPSVAGRLEKAYDHSSGSTSPGTPACGPRYVGGQVRYLNGYDSRAVIQEPLSREIRHVILCRETEITERASL